MFNADGANKIRPIAVDLRQLAYDVAILADSDAPDHFSDRHAQDLRRDGVTVTKWKDDCSLEERVFADLPWGE